MSLTVAEREHWKDRIGRRIDKRIETLVAKEDPLLLENTARRAQEKAVESLGIDPQEKGLEEIFLRRKELEQREKQLRAEQRAKISGTTVEEELSRGSSYSSYGRRAERDSKVRTAINARADAIEPDILLESDLGRRVLSLRQEKDVLLDTVWLATSPKQIKELWEQVNALLSACPTTLESKALEMEPAEGE